MLPKYLMFSCVLPKKRFDSTTFVFPSAYVGDDDNMQVRIIAGATVAVVVLLVIIIIMTVLFLRRYEFVQSYAINRVRPF